MTRSSISTVVALAAGLGLAGGCCHVKPRDFAFVQAGTGEPIIGAAVHMHQVWPEGGPCPANATSYESQRTNAAGIATFGIARNAQRIDLTVEWDRAASDIPIPVSPKQLGDEPFEVRIPAVQP
ncbi:MAG: hypothetical protein RIB60_01150 [Phycisphaerales bacterium]